MVIFIISPTFHILDRGWHFARQMYLCSFGLPKTETLQVSRPPGLKIYVQSLLLLRFAWHDNFCKWLQIGTSNLRNWPLGYHQSWAHSTSLASGERAEMRLFPTYEGWFKNWTSGRWIQKYYVVFYSSFIEEVFGIPNRLYQMSAIYPYEHHILSAFITFGDYVW